ncbi:MAG: RlmE family RNA methyltransferase [Mariprofundales bacterium]
MARSSSRWFHRHINDSWVKRAQQEGKRSRAVFKLSEILDQYPLIDVRSAVVDLGCAPGSWSEELVRRCPNGKIIGIDLLPMASIEGLTLIQQDFLSAEGMSVLKDALKGKPVDLVLSDMAPEMSGNRVVDQCAIIGLNEAVVWFCQQHLAVGGNLLMKSFMGEGFDEVRHALQQTFSSVKMVKPAASRKDSREIFFLARGRKKDNT